MIFKRNENIVIVLLYLISFLLAILLSNIFNFFKESKQIIYVAKFSNILAWILLIVFGLISIWFSIRIYLIFSKGLKKKRLIIYIVYIAISFGFISSILQYKLYLNNPDSYIIDEQVTDYFSKKRSTEVDNLIEIYTKEIDIISSYINSQNDSVLKTNLIEWQPKKTRNRNLKYVGFAYVDSICDIYFRENVVDADEPAPEGHKTTSTNFKLDAINMVSDSLDVEILINGENYQYFKLLRQDISKVPIKVLYEILADFTINREDRINRLQDNKKSILKQSLPIGVFISDTFQLITGGSQNYRALNLLGKLIEFLQKILTLIIFTPIIGELYIYIKGKSK